jgi:hypothetical protein
VEKIQAAILDALVPEPGPSSESSESAVQESAEQGAVR